jgi:hypothetical protein
MSLWLLPEAKVQSIKQLLCIKKAQAFVLELVLNTIDVLD